MICTLRHVKLLNFIDTPYRLFCWSEGDGIDKATHLQYQKEKEYNITSYASMHCNVVQYAYAKYYKINVV